MGLPLTYTTAALGWVDGIFIVLLVTFTVFYYIGFFGVFFILSRLEAAILITRGWDKINK